MTGGWRRLLILFHLLCCLLLNHVVQSQQGRPPLEDLGNVLFSVFDTSKDQKVSQREVEGQLATLEHLFSQGGGEVDDEMLEYMNLLQKVKAISPHMFQLLDTNQDSFLTKKELEFVTKFQKSFFKGGTMKPLVREFFGILDSDQNDELSKEEWLAAKNAISEITAKFHEVFPLRETSAELEETLTALFWKVVDSNEESLEHVALEVFTTLDEDGDNLLQRKEIGKAYNEYGKKFLEIAKTIQTMGPMLAMLGGGGPDGTRTEL